MTGIFIVEDQTSDALLLEETLCGSGYTVLGTATTGEEAVVKARMLKPQLILMDIVLPGKLDGIDAAVKIRSEMDVPIVFLTGYAEEELLDRAKHMVAHGYILKPYHEKQVQAAIEMALCKNDMEKQLKRAQEELKRLVLDRTRQLIKTKEQLEALLNATTDTLLLIDLEGRVIAANTVAAGRFGMTLEAFEGKNTYDLMPVELAESRRSKVEKVIRTGKPCGFEDTREGIILESSIYPVCDHQGKVFQLAIHGRNITRRKESELALHHGEARYRGIFEHTNAGVLVLHMPDSGEDFIIVDLNNAAEEIQDVRSMKVIGKHLCDVFPELKDIGLFSLFKRVWAEGKPEHQTVQQFENGSIIIWRDYFVYRLPSAEVVAVFVDQTETKRAEAAVKESQKSYRRLLDTMNEGFRVIDENKVITYANNRLCEMLGAEMEEVIGTPAATFLDMENRQILEMQFARRKSGESDSYELVLTGKGGRKIHTIVSSKPNFDEKGRFRGSFSVLTDIGKLKTTERALREKEKALENGKAALEETNAALNVLLRRREEDRNELEEKVLSNVNELVSPYVEKLKQCLTADKEKALVEIIQSNLNDIVSPLARKLTSKYFSLTPKEIRVADLIKKEKTTKEIAALMGVSMKTVEYHRENIRKKLGIKKEKVNLRSHLLSLQ